MSFNYGGLNKDFTFKISFPNENDFIEGFFDNIQYSFDWEADIRSKPTDHAWSSPGNDIKIFLIKGKQTGQFSGPFVYFTIENISQYFDESKLDDQTRSYDGDYFLFIYNIRIKNIKIGNGIEKYFNIDVNTRNFLQDKYLTDIFNTDPSVPTIFYNFNTEKLTNNEYLCSIIYKHKGYPYGINEVLDDIKKYKKHYNLLNNSVKNGISGTADILFSRKNDLSYYRSNIYRNKYIFNNQNYENESISANQYYPLDYNVSLLGRKEIEDITSFYGTIFAINPHNVYNYKLKFFIENTTSQITFDSIYFTTPSTSKTIQPTMTTEALLPIKTTSDTYLSLDRIIDCYYKDTIYSITTTVVDDQVSPQPITGCTAIYVVDSTQYNFSIPVDGILVKYISSNNPFSLKITKEDYFFHLLNTSTITSSMFSTGITQNVTANYEGISTTGFKKIPPIIAYEVVTETTSCDTLYKFKPYKSTIIDIHNLDYHLYRTNQEKSMTSLLDAESATTSTIESSLNNIENDDYWIRDLQTPDHWKFDNNTFISSYYVVGNKGELLWGHDGIYAIHSGLCVSDSNTDMFPVITKYHKSMFPHDQMTGSEDSKSFTNKKYSISQIIQSRNGTDYIYSVRTKDASDNNYTKNKVHIYYSGDRNQGGSCINIYYDLEKLFPLDYENIGNILGIKDFGYRKKIGYPSDFSGGDSYLESQKNRSWTDNLTLSSWTNSTYANIINIPPGLLNGISYTIIPNNHFSVSWKFFYFTEISNINYNNSETTTGQITNLNYSIGNVDSVEESLFTTAQNVENTNLYNLSSNSSDNDFLWKITEKNRNYLAKIEYDEDIQEYREYFDRPIYNFAEFFSYSTNAFAFSGEKSFGIIIGNPSIKGEDTNIKAILFK